MEEYVNVFPGGYSTKHNIRILVKDHGPAAAILDQETLMMCRKFSMKNLNIFSIFRKHNINFRAELSTDKNGLFHCKYLSTDENIFTKIVLLQKCVKNGTRPEIV